MPKTSYKKSGVDIAKADRLVRWIKTQSLITSAASGQDYAGLFPLSFEGYREPVLAASADGVGTKIQLAAYYSEWEGIGQDLLAMCANDLICVGAKPLFFLDYYACGQLESGRAKTFLKGLNKACEKADCLLLGGETAELPGVFPPKGIDCAGFCVGLVERSKILTSRNVCAGDDIVAFKSSGFHSNGYSLIRKVYQSTADLKKYRKILMEPTRLYTFLPPLFNKISGLRALAHITGGGLDNLSRILPKGLQAELKPWAVPPCFLDLKRRAELPWDELLKSFNCGLGLVMILKDKNVLQSLLPSEDLLILGQVRKQKMGTQKNKAWLLDIKAMEGHNT